MDPIQKIEIIRNFVLNIFTIVTCITWVVWLFEGIYLKCEYYNENTRIHRMNKEIINGLLKKSGKEDE